MQDDHEEDRDAPVTREVCRGCYDTGISTMSAIIPMPCGLCVRRELGLPTSIWYEKGSRPQVTKET